jgi:protease-4
MSMTADQIVDRRRLRRKLSFWRVVAFLVILVAIVGAVISTAGRDSFPLVKEPQIARVTVSGFIANDRNRDELLARLARTDAVKGVIVSIDSTGGATAGGEALYEGVRQLAEKKPTVATIATFGASAAYMTAIATDHIVARRSSITGSIGVLFQYPEVSDLLKNLGVKVEDIKSAPLKASPSLFEPTSEEARRVIQGVVDDTYNWFVDIVAERRGLARADALSLADGRIYTGQQALEANLIDEVGGEQAAIAWLAGKGIDAKLPVRDWKPANAGPAGLFSFANAAAFWIAEKTGIAPNLLRGGVLDRILPESLKLDGLMSVWQGSAGAGAQPAEGAAQ